MFSPDFAKPSLDNTYGAVFVGTLLGMGLYGLVVHQIYRYFRLYPDDSWWLKTYVFAVLALETFHIFICSHLCYTKLITDYGRPEALITGLWSLNLLLITSGATIFTSQCFFARRVFLLGTHYYRVLVVVACAFLLGELGLFCAATREAWRHKLLLDFEQYTWMVAVGAALGIAGDIILTSILVMVLRHSRTGAKNLDTVVDTLMMYSLNTGLLTTIMNCLFFVFTLLFPNNLIYAALGIVCTKLYANSILAALNARRSLVLRSRFDTDTRWTHTPPSSFPSVTMIGSVPPSARMSSARKDVRYTFDAPLSPGFPRLPESPGRSDSSRIIHLAPIGGSARNCESLHGAQGYVPADAMV